MRDNKNSYFVRAVFFVFALVLLNVMFSSGCKKSEPFDINGVWELFEATTYDDGTQRTYSTFFHFSGDQNQGSALQHPHPGGIQSGEYQVIGSEITFEYWHGRAIYFARQNYIGEISPETDRMIGTMTGATLQSGKIIRTWAGTWAAVKTDIKVEQ